MPTISLTPERGMSVEKAQALKPLELPPPWALSADGVAIERIVEELTGHQYVSEHPFPFKGLAEKLKHKFVGPIKPSLTGIRRALANGSFIF